MTPSPEAMGSIARAISATGPVTVSLTTNVANGADGTDSLSSIENVVGGAFGDTLTGDGNVNRLEGSGGDDLLRGGLGDDTLDGGSGSDTASWWLASGGVTVHLALGTATGAAGTDTLSRSRTRSARTATPTPLPAARRPTGLRAGAATTCCAGALGQTRSTAGPAPTWRAMSVPLPA